MASQVGDAAELQAIKRRFSGLDYEPHIGSTKSLTGHALGAAGVCEGVQFVMGATRVAGEGVALIFGLQDCEAARATFSLAELQRLLAFEARGEEEEEETP